MQIFLYSTLGCHLCEQAKTIVFPVLLKYQFHLNEIDISASDAMIERYGIRIPVLAAAEHTAELGWPFTAEQVDHFFYTLKHP